MEIKPFKAYRFNSEAVGDTGNCIAPPYDVISPAQQDQLYQKSQYNIVRITKGKTTPSDTPENNQYTRAAAFLKEWIDKGVLKQDASDSIYAYVQDFAVAGGTFRRYSFIALAKLEPFGPTVRPHEETLSGPKVDRLNLERATKAKFGLVFMLYDDKQKVADKIIEKTLAAQQPVIDFRDEYNVRHRLFAVTGDGDISAIVKMMSSKSCIIADGHHRYETALNYFRETQNPAAGYQMSAFVNTRQEGVVVLATHRMVGSLKDFDFEKFLGQLKRDFEVTAFQFGSNTEKKTAKEKMLSMMKAGLGTGRIVFGIYAAGKAFYAAELKNKSAMDSICPGKSSAWKSLDVAVLHKLILEKMLGIGEKQLADQANLEYIKDTGDGVNQAIEQIESAKSQLAFFVNPPTFEQLNAVTEVGEKMPQKSTYFYPKMYSGLTINKL